MVGKDIFQVLPDHLRQLDTPIETLEALSAIYTPWTGGKEDDPCIKPRDRESKDDEKLKMLLEWYEKRAAETKQLWDESLRREEMNNASWLQQSQPGTAHRRMSEHQAKQSESASILISRQSIDSNPKTREAQQEVKVSESDGMVLDKPSQRMVARPTLETKTRDPSTGLGKSKVPKLLPLKVQDLAQGSESSPSKSEGGVQSSPQSKPTLTLATNIQRSQIESSAPRPSPRQLNDTGMQSGTAGRDKSSANINSIKSESKDQSRDPRRRRV